MSAGKETTDSASIFSVGVNACELFFADSAGFAEVAAGVARFASRATGSVTGARFSAAVGAGVCAVAEPATSAAASAALAIAPAARAVRTARLVVVACDAESNVFPSLLSVIAIGQTQLCRARVLPARTADHPEPARVGAHRVLHRNRAARLWIDPVPIMHPLGNVSADINGDGKVNLVDFSILLFHWGTSDDIADLNEDGKVSLTDFSILLFNWTG